MKSGRQQLNRRRTRRLLRIMTPLLLASSGVVFAVAWFYQEVETPYHHEYGNQTITIAPGASTGEIFNQLRAANIISDSLSTKLWFRWVIFGKTMKAGQYRFPSPVTPREVTQTLIEGRVFNQWVTFPEGLTRFEVARLIEGLDIPNAAAAVPLTALADLIKDLDPHATDLEGYLFPDSYQYTSTTTAEQLVARMVARFRHVFNSDLQRRAQELGLSVREAVSLASMIEKEAKLPEDRALISSVYHNRLRLGMKLDCDPTVIYASVLAGTWSGVIRQSDLQRRSPYNTYLQPGLPPGPVASPGQAALVAALYPAQTDYLYFVVDGTRPDGSHRFSGSPKEHQRNVAIYRKHQRESLTRRNKD